jgi:hypothetical protein
MTNDEFNTYLIKKYGCGMAGYRRPKKKHSKLCLWR